METEAAVTPAASPVARNQRHIRASSWALAAAGATVTAGAALGDPGATASAATQVWPAFVLVAGLLLVGVVVEADGLFAAGGVLLARSARRTATLYGGASLLVVLVTAVLNLDTSVAFLTPVLVHTARARGEHPTPLLYATLLLSNAGSILLPGSNLTNLIVLGHSHVRGHEFLAHTGAPFVVAVLVTAAVVALWHRRDLVAVATERRHVARPVVGVGAVALVATLVLLLVLARPALPVLVVGATATGVRLLQRRIDAGAVTTTVGASTLVGLFGLAVAFGVVGRVWSAPAHLLTSAGTWTTAGVAALASVLVNNLPAAALLSARAPAHPYALVLGLGIGPNLLCSGSLAWILWLRSAAAAGARPSIRHATALGLVAAPLALAAAVAALNVTA